VNVGKTLLLKNKWGYVSNSDRHLLEYAHLLFRMSVLASDN